MKKIQKALLDYLTDNNTTQRDFAINCIGVNPNYISLFLRRNKNYNDVKNKIKNFLTSKGISIEEKKDETFVIEPFAVPMEKISLETTSDIIDALLHYEVVFIENSNHHIVLEEGFLVRYNHNIPFSINAPLLMDEFYYVMRPKKIKLEEGKSYKTNKGKEIFICKIDGNTAFGVILGESHARMISLEGEFDGQRIIEEV